MHPEQQVFVAEIPVNDEKAMEEFNKAMDDYQDKLTAYIHKLAIELGVNYGVAADIWYIRSRSRWTQELENRLLAAARAGKPCPYVTSGEEQEWLDQNGF